MIVEMVKASSTILFAYTRSVTMCIRLLTQDYLILRTTSWKPCANSHCTPLSQGPESSKIIFFKAKTLANRCIPIILELPEQARLQDCCESHAMVPDLTGSSTLFTRLRLETRSSRDSAGVSCSAPLPSIPSTTWNCGSRPAANGS